MAAKKATVSTEAAVAQRATAAGLRLEQSDAGYRLVHASTGTFEAAVWTAADGYGLTLGEVEAALANRG